MVQAIVAIILVLGLAFHLAAVGLIGLLVIVLLTAFNGITEEHQIGHAFEEALPFTALLVVFFAIVAVIHEQHLFTPVIEWVLHQDSSVRPAMFFLANGVLSMISDNVFVATVYINEVKAALDAGEITRNEFDKLAVAINTGTQPTQRCYAEWSGGFLIPTNVRFGTSYSTVIRPHGGDGTALHYCSRLCRFDYGLSLHLT